MHCRVNVPLRSQHVLALGQVIVLHKKNSKSITVSNLLSPVIALKNPTVSPTCIIATVDAGSCIKYKGGYYGMVNSLGKQVHYKKNTKVMVIEAFDGNRYCCMNDAYVFALELIPDRQESSPSIDDRKKKSRIGKYTIPLKTCIG